VEISRYLVVGFFCSSLFATVTKPIRWEWQTAYRRDAVRWHLENGQPSQRLFNLNFWENALLICSIYRDLAVSAKGAGGFGRKGSTFDGVGTFGYSVNLTPDRTYRVLLIPLLGYGINAEWIHQAHLNMKWFGPLVGGVFHVQPGGHFEFETSYAYHWLHLNFFQSAEKIKIDEGNNLGQSGSIRMDYVRAPYRIGILAQIQYFSSRFLSEGFKMRWTSFSTALIFARRF
jgi:hypothetical protein